jgi:hypothetical protein
VALLPAGRSAAVAAARGPQPDAAPPAAADDELARSAMRRTVVELPEDVLRAVTARSVRALSDVLEPAPAAPAEPAPAAPAPAPSSVSARSAAPAPPAEPSTGPTSGVEGPAWAVRLLLPEGDRRKFEVGRRPVVLGSGLDEVGLAGDPRVGSSEAVLFVEDGKLWVEPREGALGVYLRVRGEQLLEAGDCVLVGDIAAEFRAVDPGPAVDGARQVLGGGANAACGRLVFLRRDGTPGPVHDLPAGNTVLGRTDGHLNFPQDSRLSRRHARFFASDRGVTVEDLDSRNGTYLRVRRRVQLAHGDALRVGSAGVQVRGEA